MITAEELSVIFVLHLLSISLIDLPSTAPWVPIHWGQMKKEVGSVVRSVLDTIITSITEIKRRKRYCPAIFIQPIIQQLIGYHNCSMSGRTAHPGIPHTL